MRFRSFCSGIESASVAWKPLGWRALSFSEIEPFPCAVLAHHYPDVPNLGDMLGRRVEDETHEYADVFVAGTPCQSFSVAGLRGGLADARGNLALRFFQLVGLRRPRWVVWENVPGVLSSGGGRDFGAILGALAELGYGWAYRVLDAQYFGVAQRRRRVFVVGHSRAQCAAAVLFERASLSGNPPPSREAGARVAGSLAPGAHPGDFNGQDAHNGMLIPFDCAQITSNANRSSPKPGDPMSPLCAGGQPMLAHALTSCEGGTHADSKPHVASGFGVRRLTPRECERLQGFPDDYTLIEYRGKPAADGPRYRCLGNSMAVPVMEWIAERIEAVETALTLARRATA